MKIKVCKSKLTVSELKFANSEVSPTKWDARWIRGQNKEIVLTTYEFRLIKSVRCGYSSNKNMLIMNYFPVRIHRGLNGAFFHNIAGY
jgi:hypothetical protein